MAKRTAAHAPAAKVETPVTDAAPVVDAALAETTAVEAEALAPEATTPAPEPEAAPAPAAKVVERLSAVPSGFLPIEYIGRRATHTDGLYGTRIEWNAVGEVRLVPEDVAVKMVKINHDVYRIGAYAGEAAPEGLDAKPLDDFERQELDMVIQTMDKDALENYARTHFRQELDKRRTVETLRQEVGRMIDQFGAP